MTVDRGIAWSAGLARRAFVVAIVAAVASPAVTLAIAAEGGIFQKPPADYEVSGRIIASDGRTAAGTLSTTLGKPLEIYDRDAKAVVKFGLADVSRIDVSVEEEHEEPYWYWKESGSDEKVFTGKNYPWRKYVATVTFADGRKVTGDLDALLYVAPDAAALESTDAAPSKAATRVGGRLRFLLHRRDKGREGERPEDIVYVKAVEVARGEAGQDAASASAGSQGAPSGSAAAR